MVAAPESIMERFGVEAWILFSLGAVITILRTYARIISSGVKALQADDYLAWLGAVCIDVVISLDQTN